MENNAVRNKEGSVGLVIISYNNSSFLKEAIDSALNQTYPLNQIVICDDFSTDNSREIIQSYTRRFPGLIEAIYHPINKGVSANLNSGLRRIQQKYVSVLAGDDMWHPDKLKLEMARLLAHPEARCAYSAISLIDENGKFLKDFTKRTCLQEGWILPSVLSKEVRLMSWLIEKDLVEEVGMFDESIFVEDFDFTVRVASKAKIVFVDMPTFYYRQHSESITNKEPTEKLLNARKETYKKHSQLINSLPRKDRRKVEIIKHLHMSHSHQIIVFKTKDIPLKIINICLAAYHRLASIYFKLI